MELLAAPIPWYRTRKFWGVVISLLLAGNFFFFFPILTNSVSILDLIVQVLMIEGAASIWILFLLLFGESHLTFFLPAILYVLIFSALLYKTFHYHEVKLVYPLVIIANFLLSAAVIYIGFSSL